MSGNAQHLKPGIRPTSEPRSVARPGGLLLTLLGTLLLGTAAFAAPADNVSGLEHPENRLLAALDNLDQGRLNDALQQLDTLVRDEPSFRAAQLLYGDLLLARAGTKNDRSKSNLKSKNPELGELIEEARLRWQHNQILHDGVVPDSILELDPAQRHVVIADLKRARVYLVENRDGRPVVVNHFYASIGKNGFGKQVEGDSRTPIGVYHITSFLSDAELPNLYGSGAFPVNYPNAWDSLQGRTGHGIWLHGVPHETYSRPPRSSEGCVALANADLNSLRPFITPGKTPVILSDNLTWVDEAELDRQRSAFNSVLDNWRRDWESRDTDAYLSHYSSDLKAGRMNFNAFAAHKRRVNSAKRFIKVGVDDLSVFRYPGDENMVYTVFTQRYSSDNYSGTSRKQQYWRQENGRWKIVFEDRL